MRARLRLEAPGLVLVALAVLFTAKGALPELRIGQYPLNDLTFHRAASERLGTALARGEPFLDPWVSEWALGYPVWRSYQPLPHVLGAGVLAAAGTRLDPAATFAALLYVLVALFPASVYAGARLFGLSPIAAGLSSLLVLATSAGGEFGRYGIGYGSILWRGSGLYTQILAFHLLALTLGLVSRYLDRGRGRIATPVLLAATALSHIVFAYVAFVSAALLALVGPRGQRGRRLVRLVPAVVMALLLLAWFLLPLVRVAGEVNHSRWENVTKWDSFGARVILGELFSGNLLDHGRAPVLSVLLALAAIAAALDRDRPLARRLLGLVLLWLALFLGRETWGHLLLLLAVPADFHLHRLQGAFELSAVLLIGYGLARIVERADRRAARLGLAAALATAAAILPPLRERARYLAQNEQWGEQNRRANERERGDVEAAVRDVKAILAERPGRAAAGLAATWGKDFRIGSVPFYAYLTRAHVDEASFLYHSMSTTSEVMVLRDEADRSHGVAFGLRAVVAPADKTMPAHLRLRGKHGRFAVYEDSPEGYFGIVDVIGHHVGSVESRYEVCAAWLQSPLLRQGAVLSLDPRLAIGTAIPRWAPLPGLPPGWAPPRGRLLSETKAGENYAARLELDRPAYAFLKITWYPGLEARVDGTVTPLYRATPGFVVVPVPAGTHDVVVRYRPGPGKPLLLALGCLAFAALAAATRSSRYLSFEGTLAERLARTGSALGSERAQATLALLLAAAVALHPLFRGRLVDGHDATEYPPRLVEMARVLADGHVPPVWAPDLGAGYGQPLFAFAPPLLYIAALPLHVAGASLADALQLALAALHLLGAAALYRLGRGLAASRFAAAGGAMAWLFAPYVALDLYVRTAYAEAAAVAVCPIALLGVLRATARPSPRRITAGAAAIALVPLAHNAVAILVLPALVLVVAALGLFKEDTWRGRARSLVPGSLAILGGLGLSAYFWVPALLEKGLVKTDLLREGFLHWREHVVHPLQLLSSPWGFGLSGPGAADGMSFAIGVPHVLLGLLGALVAWRSGRPRLRAVALAALLAAAGGALLSTGVPAVLWERLTPLQYLAYPWRALALPALFLPVLSIIAIDRMGARSRLAALALLVLVNVPHTEPRGFLKYDDEYYSPGSIASKGLNTTTREEYEPRSVLTRPPYRAEELVGLDAPIRTVEARVGAARQDYVVDAERATSVEAATFFYPGWTVRVDGVRTAIQVTPVSGTIRFKLDAGRRRVSLALEPTPTRRTAARVSVATVAALALLVLVPAVRERRLRSPPGGPPSGALPGARAPRPRPPRARARGSRGRPAARTWARGKEAPRPAGRASRTPRAGPGRAAPRWDRARAGSPADRPPRTERNMSPGFARDGSFTVASGATSGLESSLRSRQASSP